MGVAILHRHGLVRIAQSLMGGKGRVAPPPGIRPHHTILNHPDGGRCQAERKLQGLYDAIAEGLRTPGLLGELQELEAERDRLVASVAEAEPTPVRLHPNLPELYRKKVAQLRDALADPLIREEAVEQLRRLMTKVTVRPGEVTLIWWWRGVDGLCWALGSRCPGLRRSHVAPNVQCPSPLRSAPWTPGRRKTAMRQGLRFMRPAGSLSQPAQQRT